MSNDLFPEVPAVPLTALQCARYRMASAQADYDKAADFADNTGNEVPRVIRDALRLAETAVHQAERDELERVKRA